MIGEHWSIFWDIFAVVGLAVIGATYTQRVGVFNVAIEGQILFASLGLSASLVRGAAPLEGIVVGITASILVGLVVGLGVVALGSDEVVLGLGLNALILGASLVISDALVGGTEISLMQVADLDGMRRGLSVGLVVILAATGALLRFSRFSLWFRSIEEDWASAENADVPVGWCISCASLAGSIVTGLAGCYMAVSLVGFGRSHWRLGLGFVALGLVVAARGKLVTGMVGAAGFAGAYVVRFAQSNSNLSAGYEFLPYAVVLVWFVVVGLGREKKWLSWGRRRRR